MPDTPFTRAEYMAIVRALHPDSSTSENRQAAFVLFTGREAVLRPDLPSDVHELLVRKAEAVTPGGGGTQPPWDMFMTPDEILEREANTISDAKKIEKLQDDLVELGCSSIVWSVDAIMELRPDLNWSQAFAVLRAVMTRVKGVSADDVRAVADDVFGKMRTD